MIAEYLLYMYSIYSLTLLVSLFLIIHFDHHVVLSFTIVSSQYQSRSSFKHFLRYKINDVDSSSMAQAAESIISSSSTTQSKIDTNNNRKYVRWNKINNGNNDTQQQSWEMQTAITTFRNPNTRTIIELHALIHFGDPNYYKYYNSLDINMNNKTISVLYELLLDEKLLFINQYGQCMINWMRDNDGEIQHPLKMQASSNDQMTASYYGWICQVDGINYVDNTKKKYQNWIHADWTTQELLLQQNNQKDEKTLNNILSSSIGGGGSGNGNVGVVWEATTALLSGPPLLLQQQYNNQQRRQRKLFTNLFINGNSFAILLRWILWFTIPCPEISILLIDSSSIWFDNQHKQRKKNEDIIPSSFLTTTTTNSDNNNNMGVFTSTLSPIILPLIQSLLNGRIQDFRKLLFGQAIISSNTVINDNEANNNKAWDFIVTQRNNKALQVLQNEINHMNNIDKDNKIIMLYGCNHCSDLHEKLVRQGYYPIQTTWRTASSIHLNNDNYQVNNNKNNWIVIGSLLVVLYLLIGALDWIGIVQNIVTYVSAVTTTPTNNNESILLEVCTDMISYVIRHVLLYIGLSRFLLDWKRNQS